MRCKRVGVVGLSPFRTLRRAAELNRFLLIGFPNPVACSELDLLYPVSTGRHLTGRPQNPGLPYGLRRRESETDIRPDARVGAGIYACVAPFLGQC